MRTPGGVQQSIACQGQPGVHGSPPAQPATWETVFTAMFLHASFLHIFGNMVFLAVFGPTVEDAMGRLRYLVFYLLGGLVALAAQVAVSPSSTSPTLGASGAIAAVLGGYILLYPRARCSASSSSCSSSRSSSCPPSCCSASGSPSSSTSASPASPAPRRRRRRRLLRAHRRLCLRPARHPPVRRRNAAPAPQPPLPVY